MKNIVTIFSKENCFFSDSVKKWFREFEDRNIVIDHHISNEKFIVFNNKVWKFDRSPIIFLNNEYIGNYKDFVNKQEYINFLLS